MTKTRSKVKSTTTKRCCNCRRYKATHLFNRNSARPDKLQTQCRFCQAKSSKKHYKVKSNAKVMIKQTKQAKYKRRLILQEYVAEYRVNNPCVDCNSKDIRGLQFDHVRGKKLFDISLGIKEGMPLTKLQKEINKCVVRCAKCHQIRTSKKNNDYLNKYVKKHKIKYNKEQVK